MRSITQKVPLTSTSLRVALCQIATPTTAIDPDLAILDSETLGPPQFVWRDLATIERRRKKIDRILDFLKNDRPQLVAFPEYSVPFECHGTFQRFANENSCIVVPGSYYERAKADPYYGNNVVRIYIPGQDPLVIVKHDRFGDEERTLTKYPANPNIAHLTWTGEEGTEVSASIFVCRDYLKPYDQENRSLLDWRRSGFNLVLMLSPQTELFEAVAGLAARRLQGQGRFVGLCNCAGTNANASVLTGTSLLGPTKESRRRGGDVIERLPSDREGILTAEVDLKRVEYIETRPSKQEHDPLGRVKRYFILKDTEGNLRFDIGSELSSSERGVWHPALLEALGRNIKIVLRKSRRTREVTLNLRDPSTQSFHFVSAAGLLGEYDFMFRLYEQKGGELTLQNSPYCSLSPGDQDRLFEREEDETFVVSPDSIYKYRTNKVTPNSPQWQAKKAEFERLLHPANRNARREQLSALCRLARDWNDHNVAEHREQFKRYFLEKVEIVHRLGPKSGNSLRRRYILVSLSSGESLIGKFEQRVISAWLIDVPEVRSIFRLVTTSKLTQFHFWIDVVADPYEADTLLQNLQHRCEDEKIEIGTRSIDVMHQLLNESIEGIENTDYGAEICKFLKHMDGVPLNHSKILEHDQVLCEVAKEWYRDTGLLGEPSIIQWLTAFYVQFFVGNFGRSTRAQQIDCLREAANRWQNIYQDLETACKQVLNGLLGVTEDTKREDALKTHFGPAKDQLWNKLRTDSVRSLLEYMTSCSPELRFFKIEDLKAIKSQYAMFSQFRNDMTHDGNDRKEKVLYLWDMAPENRAEAVSKVTEATRILTDLLRGVRSGVQLKKAAP